MSDATPENLIEKIIFALFAATRTITLSVRARVPHFKYLNLRADRRGAQRLARKTANRAD